MCSANFYYTIISETRSLYVCTYIATAYVHGNFLITIQVVLFMKFL